MTLKQVSSFKIIYIYLLMLHNPTVPVVDPETLEKGGGQTKTHGGNLFYGCCLHARREGEGLASCPLDLVLNALLEVNTQNNIYHYCRLHMRAWIQAVQWALLSSHYGRS